MNLHENGAMRVGLPAKVRGDTAAGNLLSARFSDFDQGDGAMTIGSPP